jgi:hypothetical protein
VRKKSYVIGDDHHPYNIFDFTLNRGRDGPKYFLQDYNQVLLADAYGRVLRGGGRQRHHPRWMLGASSEEDHRGGENGAREQAARLLGGHHLSV